MTEPDRRVVPYSIKNATKLMPHVGAESAWNVISRLVAMPEVWEPFRDSITTKPFRTTTGYVDTDGEVNTEYSYGRWELVFLMFVASGIPDVRRWYDNHMNTAIFAPLRDIGFHAVPSYATVQRKFIALEHDEPAFQAVISALVKMAKLDEPCVGQWLAVDSTSALTHGQLQHDCKPGDVPPCANGESTRSPTFHSATGADLQAIRQRANDVPADDAAGTFEYGKQTWNLDDDDGGLAPDFGLAFSAARGKRTKYRREFRGGHWWRTNDVDAGLRIYRGANGKVMTCWHGFYITQFIDYVTGLPVMAKVSDARKNESKIYVEEAGRLKDIIGHWPVGMSADRGYSMREVFEFNTRRNIASAIPWRRWKGAPATPPASDRFDEDGIPKCKGCGGGGDYIWAGIVGNSDDHDDGKPVVRFLCAMPKTAKCKETQIPVEDDWTRLVPIWRTSRVYLELEAKHSNFERVHKDFRDRYGVGPTSVETRPRRMGIPCQQLRVTAAVLIRWLTVGTAQNWYGSTMPGKKPTEIVRSKRAATLEAALIKRRQEKGLTGGGYPSRMIRPKGPGCPARSPSAIPEDPDVDAPLRRV